MPGGLQLCELAALAQRLNDGIDGIAEIGALWSISNPKPLMGRHLHHNGEVRSLAREPRNYREELNHEADLSGFEVIERRFDPVIWIIADRSDCPLRHQVPSDNV